MDRNTVNSPPLYFPRYVVRTLQVQLSDTSVRDVCFIYIEDEHHIPIRVTDIQDEYSGAAEPPVRCGLSHLSGAC